MRTKELIKHVQLIVVTLIALTLSSIAQALVGTPDTKNEFPFVVKLRSEFKNSSAFCSGVVHGHILSTAAHCFYTESGILANRVTVTYVDVLGKTQQALAQRLYVPKAYIEDDALHHNDWKGTVHDIGYAVLDREVLVKGYIHWGIELLDGIGEGKSECAEPECMDWSLVGDRRTAFLRNLQREVGDLDKAKVRVIGFGNYKCKNFKEREQDCESDENRRFTELQLNPDATAPYAPWVWCTGKNEAGTNPVQHGDSGGPVFIQALDGRWIYVGYTSRGDSDEGCASSMFNDLNLWRDAIAAYSFGKIKTLPIAMSEDAIAAWEESAAKQFFGEWLLAENAPAGKWSASSVGRLYAPVATYDYHGKTLSIEKILEDKAKNIARWPERELSPTSYEVNCEQTTLHVQDTCTIRSTVKWSVKNAAKSLSGTTQIILNITVPRPFSKGLLLGPSNPGITSELNKSNSEYARSGFQTQRIEKRVKTTVADGYLNMRSGPGQNFSVILQIPAGDSVWLSDRGCVMPDDGVSKYAYCNVNWHNQNGWVSINALE